MNKAEELIACLEGEIAKRDETIARLEPQLNRSIQANYDLRAELEAIKAQEPVAWVYQDQLRGLFNTCGSATCAVWNKSAGPRVPLYAVPVSEAKAQEQVAIEFRQFMTDVVTGAGLLSCGKQSKGLAAELSANAYKYLLGAPVHEAKSQGVVQWPEADEIMQMAFEEGQPADDASGYCFELEEFDLFIERLMSEVARLNAATVQQPKCQACNDNGMIGGPSFYAPDEGGDPCPDCCAPVQQVSVTDGWKHGLPQDGEICEARIPHHTADGRQMIWCEVEVIAHSIIKGAIYSWVKETGQDGSFYAPMMLSFRKLAAASAAPAADAGHVFYGMDGNHP